MIDVELFQNVDEPVVEDTIKGAVDVVTEDCWFEARFVFPCVLDPLLSWGQGYHEGVHRESILKRAELVL